LIPLDSLWLSNGNLTAMPYVQTKYSTSRLRVALIIEGGTVKPVWFDQTDKPASDRVHLKGINARWTSQEGAARVMHLTGMDLCSHQLCLDTLELTWKLGVVGESS